MFCVDLIYVLVEILWPFNLFVGGCYSLCFQRIFNYCFKPLILVFYVASWDCIRVVYVVEYFVWC